MKLRRNKVAMLVVGFFVIPALFLTAVNIGCAKKVEITWWDWETNPQGVKRIVFERAFKEYGEKHPEVRFVAEHYPGDAYWQKMLAAVAAGTGPVVAMLDYDNIVDYLTPTPFLDPYPESLFPYDQLEQEYERMEQFKWVDGKYYLVSAGWDTPVMFYNKKIFDEKGISLPTNWTELPCSWEEFITLAKKVTEIDSKGNIKRAGMADIWTEHFFLSLLYQFGGSLTKDNASKPNINTEAGLEALKLIGDMYLKHKIVVPTGWDASWDDFVNGRVATRADFSWATDYLGSEENVGVDLRVGPQPFLGKPEEPSVPKFYYGLLQPPSTPGVFSVWPEETKRATWKFIKFLFEEGYMAELAFRYNMLPTRKADQKLIEEWGFKYKTTDILRKYVPHSLTLFTYPAPILEVLVTMTEEVSIGEVEPAVALERANKQIEEILAEKEEWGIRDIR